MLQLQARTRSSSKAITKPSIRRRPIQFSPRTQSQKAGTTHIHMLHLYKDKVARQKMPIFAQNSTFQTKKVLK